MTRQMVSPVPFNSWSIYRRPEIHWASIGRYRADNAWVLAKFFIRLKEELGLYGFYIERSKDRTESRVDWLSFLNWLAVESQAMWLHQSLADCGMWIFDPYPDFDGAFARSICPRGAGWLVEQPGSKSEIVATFALSDYLAAVEEGKWLNLMIGRQRPANEMVSAGVNIALEIAADFNALLPVYLSRAPS